MDLLITTFQAVLKIFLMVAVGIVGDKTGILDADSCAKMTRVNMYLLTPFMVINGFFMEYNSEKVFGLGMSVLFSALMYAVGIAVSKIIVSRKSETRTIEEASVIYTNCGFLGVPLAQTMFGTEGVFYMSIHSALCAVFFWPYVTYLFFGKGDKNTVKRIVSNPTIYAAFIGIAIYLLQIPVPEILKSPIASVGNIAAPLSLVLAGSMISRADLKAALKMSKTYIVSVGRLIIVPVIVMFIIKFLPGPAMAKTCGVVAAACPVATNVQIAAQIYGKDEKTASLFFGVSTAACLISIPLMVSLYGLIA